MTRAVLLQKVDSIVRCLERVELKRPASAALLATNVDAQDILILNLERAVQLCVDIAGILVAERGLKPVPTTMADAFDVLCSAQIISEKLKDRMRKSVGFRNLAVHEYDKINWEIVYRIASEHLVDFKEFARVTVGLN
jgi:uncharacterized protein YutE (UPF0331/DUF86 family)